MNIMYKEKLKDIRTRKKIKQEEIANHLGLHRGSYSKYEIEDCIIPTKHLNYLCNYFNISFDYIFNFTNKKSYNEISKDINVDKTKIRLKELRKELNINQESLAKTLGTAKTTISGYERGARIIATPFLYDICKKYNISADYLLGKVDEPKYLKEKDL